MGLKVDDAIIIEAYNRGESMNSIARTYSTYPATIQRILEKNNVKLRHDSRAEGKLYVKDGEKLIEWAKAQGRPVTKAELATVIGKKKLSPSYFVKYPELGKYVTTRGYDELKDLHQKLYKWLKENDIPYKPDDRTKLGVSVSALLLGEYSNIALQIAERPKCVSNENHDKKLQTKHDRAIAAGIDLICLYKEHFDNDLEYVKLMLSYLKK